MIFTTNQYSYYSLINCYTNHACYGYSKFRKQSAHIGDLSLPFSDTRIHNFAVADAKVYGSLA